jgi:hypothetical protein
MFAETFQCSQYNLMEAHLHITMFQGCDLGGQSMQFCHDGTTTMVIMTAKLFKGRERSFILK